MPTVIAMLSKPSSWMLVAVMSAAGRVKSLLGQRYTPSWPTYTASKIRLAPQRGHVRASAACGRSRSATLVSSIPSQSGGAGRSRPISATRGSSAFRRARLPAGRRSSADSIRFAIDSSSPYLSSWSRKRLSTITAFGWISSTAFGRLASSISKTPQSALRRPSAPALSRAAAVAPKMRLAPARLDTTRWPAPSSSQLISRAVVVLPLVPVMTTDPNFRSRASFLSTSGSIARATSPGSVVPPPRRLSLDNMPVAFPASTAAVRRIMPRVRPNA